jgi:lysophospholipase
MVVQHKWLTSQQQAVVVLVHGTGEHYGRYEHVAAFLNEHGFDVYTGDLPGWGHSAGRKGHIDSFEQYLDTVRVWVDEALNASQGIRPVFLLGHSLGGLVATRFVQSYGRKREIKGLVLTSPCLKLKLAVPAWKEQLAQWLDRVWPTLAMPNGITPDMVSRDRVVQAAYSSDPLNYSKVSVRWFQELNRAMAQAWQERDRLDIPTLVLQAGDDRLIDADAIERFVEGMGGDAAFHRFPDLRHEVLNEPEREQVMQWMVRWMNHLIAPNVTY